MSDISLTQLTDNMKRITLTDKITNTSLEVRVFRDFSYEQFPDMYGVLIHEVENKIGLQGDTFRLKNVRDNTLYPRCLDHMFELRRKPLTEMGIKGDDHLEIVRIWQANSPSGLCQNPMVTVADKINQTEKDDSNDLIRIRAVPSEHGEYKRYNRKEYDVYVRKYYRIIDLSDEFRRVSRNEGKAAYSILWQYKGNTYEGNDTTALTIVGISDGSAIEYSFSVKYSISRSAGDPGKPYSSRSIGVQTVAKPAVQYPPVQPPPPVNNPPPAKT